MKKRRLRWILAIVVLFLVFLILPFGRKPKNPAVRQEPAWDSPKTRALAVRACYDCHSNETVWPWYAGMPPVSWWLKREIREGREALNFSEWDRPQEEAGESAESVAEGEMPPRLYTFMHPSARLSPSERQALIQGLEATLGRKKDDDD
jgi:mono/diheme cytochrome c family protein